MKLRTITNFVAFVKGGVKMRVEILRGIWWIVALVALVWFESSGAALAQYRNNTAICRIWYTLSNKDRAVAGHTLTQECTDGAHSAPFGNWGVDSNYNDHAG